MAKRKTKQVVEHQVKIIEVAKNALNLQLQGIHLIDPNQADLDNAMHVAHRDLYDTIYIHYTDVIDLKRYKSLKKVG